MSRFIAPLGRYTIVALLISLLSFSSFAQVQSREALDFDGDEKADFTIYRPSENAFYVLGSTGFFKYQQWGIANEDRMVPGDYDGDNKADIAVWRDSQGLWYVINSSDNTFSGTNWGTDGDEPIARDYDGDGKTDYAIIRRTGGYMYWWILYSAGGATSTPWGVDSDFAVPGDYDGDGKFDHAIQRGGPTPTSQAEFWVLASSGGYFAVPWGWGSDYAVPGDYDDDGSTDIAVVREGALPTDPLIWYILRSDLNGYIIESFGTTGDDYNTQADYDGDGATDISFWRQSTGTFFVRSSINGSVSEQRWGAPGDLPLAAYDTH